MKQNNTNNYNGISFLGLLTIVFIALKLTHVIDWSWVWVLAPLWGQIILGIILIILYVIANKRR